MYDRDDLGCVALIFTVLLYVPLLIVVGSVANGFALVKLWEWFIVPIFNVSALTVVQAIGISMVVGFLTYQATSSDDSSSGDKSLTAIVSGSLIAVILRPAIVLFFGWIVTLFL